MSQNINSRVHACFNPLPFYKEDLKNCAVPEGIRICRGLVSKNSTLREQCATCKLMNKETQDYIENRTCCACEHWQKCLCRDGPEVFGEWSDTCSRDGFVYKFDEFPAENKKLDL